MTRIPLQSEEYDAFSKWRHLFLWKPGELKKIKRRYRKRVRRAEKQLLREVMQ